MGKMYKQKNMDVEQLIFRSDFHKCRKIVRALLARVLLYGHASVSIWLAGQVDTRYYGIYAVSSVMFIVETLVIIWYRYGCEWKLICTCFCCYIVTMVTVLWILHIDVINRNDATSDNSTTNETSATTTPQPTTLQNIADNGSTTPSTFFDSLGGSKALKSIFSDQTLISLLEQSMMILIIICRWLLPRGRIDRDSLSQLLMMYSAISADILDFSDIIDREEVYQHVVLRYVVLAVWTWSLLQFTIVTTSSFTLRRNNQQANSAKNDAADKSETIAIIMAFALQDGPFLVTRCYALSLGVFDYMILFFSLKNVITLILGLYRLCVLCGCIATEGNDLLRKSEIARSMESLDDLDFSSKSRRRKKVPGSKVKLKSNKPIKGKSNLKKY